MGEGEVILTSSTERLDLSDPLQVDDIRTIILWWEDDLTAKERTTFLDTIEKGYSWSGSREKRHEELRLFYSRRNIQ